MTTQEIINGLQNVLDYCRYHQDAPALREAINTLGLRYQDIQVEGAG